jgi:two-component system, chemotaxis family, protein-glutamate methylesterase/glutaminase
MTRGPRDPTPIAGVNTLGRPIRVLVVDDSAAFRQALALALGSDPEIDIVGQASDGKSALQKVHELRPDVVTMDVMMPVMDGLEAAKTIMKEHPVPIILLSTLARTEEQRIALNALRLGVVDVANKPALAGPNAPGGIASMVRLVRAAAGVEVAPRRHTRHDLPAVGGKRTIDLIAVAASTGGPPALEMMLKSLPSDSPPVVIAQHLAASFARGFAEWLAQATGRIVANVAISEPLVRGRVYVAAEHMHIRVSPGFAEGVKARPGDLAPNADILFHAVAQSFAADAIGVVLTGMGNDGAAGLGAMRAAGAWTIAQDRDSSVVWGMPRVAHEAGACCEVLPLDDIAPRIVSLLTPADGARA